MLALPERSLSSLDTVHCIDALRFVTALPDESVDCVVTSPPFYGLRDYGVDGQIGLEDTPQAFITRLVGLFSQIRRVLKKTGVCWVNLGDSYASGEIGRHDSVQANNGREWSGTKKATIRQQQHNVTNLPSKSLLMIPARFAIAMQDDGWILRSECVWVKPNPMPESVKDRPTKSHEMVYMFTRSPRYWYDADAVREMAEAPTRRAASFRDGGVYTNNRSFNNSATKDKATHGDGEMGIGRNRRDVFTIATEPTPFAHFATFPQALIEPLILAGCPEKLCAECGKPYEREVEVERTIESKSKRYNGVSMRNDANNYRQKATHTDKGIHPTCTCNAATRAGVVFDPFMGSGTTALVARRLGRHYLGCELNPKYAALANTRLSHNTKEELTAALAGKPATVPMFEHSSVSYSA